MKNDIVKFVEEIVGIKLTDVQKLMLKTKPLTKFQIWRAENGRKR